MKMLKNVIVLTLITVIAGFLLGYVYDITKEPIAIAQEKELQDALKAVSPDSDSFEETEVVNADAVLLDAGLNNDRIDKAYISKDSSGNVSGYVMSVTSTEGYGGEINIILGIKNDGTISGLEILSISETPGLGMQADTDEFKSQFAGKNVSSISYTKTGASEDYEIDALSGATITTNAMTNAVNAGLAYFNSVNSNGGEANE